MHEEKLLCLQTGFPQLRNCIVLCERDPLNSQAQSSLTCPSVRFTHLYPLYAVQETQSDIRSKGSNSAVCLNNWPNTLYLSFLLRSLGTEVTGPYLPFTLSRGFLVVLDMSLITDFFRPVLFKLIVHRKLLARRSIKNMLLCDPWTRRHLLSTSIGMPFPQLGTDSPPYRPLRSYVSAISLTLSHEHNSNFVRWLTKFEFTTAGRQMFRSGRVSVPFVSRLITIFLEYFSSH